MISKSKNAIRVQLPCGAVTTIDRDDEWILKTFPSWVKVKHHVQVGRHLQTEFGTAHEVYWIHRLITRPPQNLQVDHKNRDPMDNRKSNLRFATAAQNSANCVRNKRSTSGYRGVCLDKREPKLRKPWRAYGRKAGMTNHTVIGYFASAEEAARAYDGWALKVYGDFAILNFPS